MSLKPSSPGIKATRGAFTLIELLVAMTVLLLLVSLMLTLFSGVSSIWGEFQARKSREQTARVAMEAISRDLRAAAFPSGTHIGDTFAFLISPPSVGTEHLMPGAAFWQSRNPTSPVGFFDVGYFVRWVGNQAELCQLRVPHDDADSIFQNRERELSPSILNRLAPGGADADLRGLLADHVIGIWFRPVDLEGTAIPLPYDSRTAAVRPAFVDVWLAVIDPATSNRVGDASAVQAAYSDDPSEFLDSLPAPIAQGVRIYTERVPIHANP